MLGIEYIRTQLEMNITDVAKLLSVSRQIVSKWEKGEKNIPDKRIKELSELFKIPEQYFSKELNYADKINVTSLINKDRFNSENVAEEFNSEIETLISELIVTNNYEPIRAIYENNKEEYFDFVDKCKEKITIAQRKLVMDISICDNMAKSQCSVEHLEKLLYYSQLYTDMTGLIMHNPMKAKVIANVLNEFMKENKND